MASEGNGVGSLRALDIVTPLDGGDAPDGRVAALPGHVRMKWHHEIVARLCVERGVAGGIQRQNNTGWSPSPTATRKRTA